MIGAIAGDIIGSIYEFQKRKPAYNFKPLFHLKVRFTDDTLHTIALMDSILNDIPYNRTLKDYFNRFPNKGHGKMFKRWAEGSYDGPYNSFGNGSAMRTSPVGWIKDTAEETVQEATKYASVTHSHPHGIRGAVSTSLAILMARNGVPKEKIVEAIKNRFYPIMDKFDYEWLVEKYTFDVTCEGTLPVVMKVFGISEGYEDCIRKCVSVGGDTDTICAIAGGISEAYWGVPDEIKDEALSYLTPDMREILNEFYDRYKIN